MNEQNIVNIELITLINNGMVKRIKRFLISSLRTNTDL